MRLEKDSLFESMEVYASYSFSFSALDSNSS